jgi:hypothetical protein
LVRTGQLDPNLVFQRKLENMESTQQGTHAPEVFISYSRQDQDICRHIVNHLLNCGIVVWIDTKAIEAGESWVNAIFRGLERADYIIVLISSNAVESRWVHKEVETALINSLSQKRTQMIVPILLENVELPMMLRSLQSINLIDGIPWKIPLISDFILNQPIEIDLRKQLFDGKKGSDVPTDRSGLGGLIREIANNYPLAQYATAPDRGHATTLYQDVLKLHITLLRLQAVVEEFGHLSGSDADHMWEYAGRLMEGPIPGTKRMVEAIDRRKAIASSEEAGLYLALLRRYIEIMGELLQCLHASFSTYIQIEAPELSAQLSQLFRTKINVNRVIKGVASQLALKSRESVVSPETHIRYLEAAKTFEARVLLQVIDEDARSVAHDPETGWTVFGEIVNRNKEILLCIIGARREIGLVLKRLSRFQSGGGELPNGHP